MKTFIKTWVKAFNNVFMALRHCVSLFLKHLFFASTVKPTLKVQPRSKSKKMDVQIKSHNCITFRVAVFRDQTSCIWKALCKSS